MAADDVDHPKPEPDAYQKAVKLLAKLQGGRRTSPSDYVAIEDSQWGLSSARSAGLRTIGITNSYPETSLTAADLIVDHLDKVTLNLLQQLCETP